MFDPPAEDPSHIRPDIVLDAAAQSVITAALEVARHNQEFRDGTRTKPFSGAFVLSEIDNAARVMAEAQRAAERSIRRRSPLMPDGAEFQ